MGGTPDGGMLAQRVNRSWVARPPLLLGMAHLRGRFVLPQRGSAPTSPALMNIAQKPTFVLRQRHLLGIEGLSRDEITGLLDRAEEFVELNRQIEKKQST